jgi:PAS domain S-box-containing protein
MSAQQQDFQPLSVLGVDDDVNVLDMLRKYFERKPEFSVFTCTTPSEALELISKYQFDAVIAEYALPGMDGITFLQEIRAQNDPVLFITLTGCHPAQTAIDTQNSGGNYYLEKGADLLFAIQKVEHYIRTTIGNRRLTHPVPGNDNRYRSLVEQQPDLFCCFLPDGTCTFANSAYSQFIGRNEPGTSGTNFFALIPRNEWERVQKLLSTLTTQYPGVYIEHHMLERNGEPLLFQWSYRAFFTDQGNVHEYLAQGRDLSNVVKLDETLPAGSFLKPGETAGQRISPAIPELTVEKELTNLAETIDQVQFPIFAVDKEGVVIAWNNAIAELTGMDARTIIGQGNYAYAFPIYGESRPMLIDAVLRAASGQDIESVPGITRDGDSYNGDVENVTIRGKPLQVWGKGTPIFDSKGDLIAAVQSLLISAEPEQEDLFDDVPEEYIGGVSGIHLKIAGEGIGGARANAVGTATGRYGVYATDKRLLIVRDNGPDTLRNEEEPSGAMVDTSPRSVADLEKIRVFEIWRSDITSIEMKTPHVLAGFLIIKTTRGGSYRISTDNKKAFGQLEKLLNLFYGDIIRMEDGHGTTDLEWPDEIHMTDLIGKLQIEDPFNDVTREVTTNLPPIQIHNSSSISRDQCREIAESTEHIPYPVFAIDRLGIVIAWNRAIASLSGIGPQEMIGKGDYEYSYPFFGERKPMLIDYIIMAPDAQVQGEPPAITREGDTVIGTLQSAMIRGRPMLLWGKGTGIYNTRGTAIAAIQSILFSEQPDIYTLVSGSEHEQYLGGLSSITVNVPGNGIAGAIAGALGSATAGYGIYATDKRIFITRNPEPDAIRTREMPFGEFIIDKLFGTTVDTNPRSLAELGKMKVFEVARKDIITIEMKKPLLFAGYMTFRVRNGEAFRVYTGHKLAFIHLEQLLRLYYHEILRIG